jgi:radical SAM-linked protein
MVRERIRIRFRKAGDLRLIGHHDLMRCWERMLRRASLPFHSSEGFNPKPRLVFALSLGLGIVGCEEVVELELDDSLPVEEIRDRLANQAPAGMEIFQVQRVDSKTAAMVQRVCYRVAVPQDRQIGLREKLVEILGSPHCWMDRTRPQPRRIDLKPYLLDLRLNCDGLEMVLQVTPNGTARPDEVLRLLGLGDLLESGAVLERTTVELQDESQAASPDAGSLPPIQPKGNL